MRCKLSYCLMLFFSLSAFKLQAQNISENVVQVNGIIMTRDSTRLVSYATISVKGQNKGVLSSARGVFTIVCYKGDTLQFSELGFRPREYTIPKDIKGEYYSMIELMTQDTFYLPETIIRPLPTREEFDYAFRHWSIPDDQYEIARKNTDKYTLRAIAYSLPRDGRESQALYQNQQWHDAMYYGQRPIMNVLNPLAWGEFFEAWKRGDFRNQNPSY